MKEEKKKKITSVQPKQADRTKPQDSGMNFEEKQLERKAVRKVQKVYCLFRATEPTSQKIALRN
jgi:hypothetical protein